ncbi:lipopolysaccharide biosynthesis protein [Paenibacillus koleovorans]|uniref:lipopolysaccharide biosynthesis protein n=1 Tax=Paenibacillus koleovorans TaxID=121608 RepID=UPI000FD8501E|nr:oligosaccharide flippase family protein [Paenibacillus koleovorans]
MKRKALRYLSGNLLYAAAQFVIVVLLSKFGSAADVGRYALGLAVTAPIFMLSHLHLRAVYIVDSSSHAHAEARDYIGLRGLTTVLAVLVTLGVIGAAGFDGQSTAVIGLIMLSRIIESISDILFGICQKQDKLDIVSASRAAKGLISILSIALVYIPTQSLSFALLTMIIGWFVIACVFEGRAASRFVNIRPAFDRSKLSTIARKSLPLGIVLALVSLNANLPQYAISAYLGDHELGVYAAMSYLIVACQVVVTALGEAFTPRLASWHEAGADSQFATLMKRMIALGLAVSAAGVSVGWLFGSELLKLLFSPEMAAYTAPFRWLLLTTAFVFAGSVLWYGLVAAGLFKRQIPLFLLTIACNGLLCWWLVPRSGLIGAAQAICAAWVVQTVGSFVLLRRELLRRANSRRAENTEIHSNAQAAG